MEKDHVKEVPDQVGVKVGLKEVNVSRGNDMPLAKGSSKSVISKNIAECIRSYKESGKVGNTHPKNLKHAMRICSAAAYTSARKSKSVVSEALRK